MKAGRREKGLLSRLRSWEPLADGGATGSGHPLGWHSSPSSTCLPSWGTMLKDDLPVRKD